MNLDFDVDPLPWSPDEDTLTERSICVVNGDGRAVATVHADPEYSRALLPLARLIAASPELLSVCEMVLKMDEKEDAIAAEHGDTRELENELYDLIVDLVAKARAAIAKIKRES